MKTKDMFYRSGAPNPEDGKCIDCPFLVFEDGKLICPELEEEVNTNGKINGNCPFITPDRA